MKTLKQLTFAMIIALAFASCGSEKQMTNNQPQQQQQGNPTPNPTPTPSQTPDQTNPSQSALQYQGISMVDELSEDGMTIRQVAYKWYAGYGKSDNKRLAIRMAEGDARAAVARIIETTVLNQMELGSITNNSKTQEALKEHWNQVSMNILKACEPFGDVICEEEKGSSGEMFYNTVVKVGLRGDRFIKILDDAGKFKPTTLQGEELQQFIDVNNSIMEAAKGI